MAVNVDVNTDEVKGFEAWLKSLANDYQKLTSSQRLGVLCRLSKILSPSELYDYSNYMTDLLHRDFISCLPAELVDYLLSYVDHKSLLSACCVSIRLYNYISLNTICGARVNAGCGGSRCGTKL